MYYGIKSIEDVIDLHGLRADQAERELVRFLNSLIRKRARQALIIHGKGAGVLKDLTAECLSVNSYVARYYKAPPHLGGEGATVAEFCS
jgi:DNA mismatch repair protein MutS2